MGIWYFGVVGWPAGPSNMVLNSKIGFTSLPGVYLPKNRGILPRPTYLKPHWEDLADSHLKISKETTENRTETQLQFHFWNMVCDCENFHKVFDPKPYSTLLVYIKKLLYNNNVRKRYMDMGKELIAYG